MRQSFFREKLLLAGLLAALEYGRGKYQTAQSRDPDNRIRLDTRVSRFSLLLIFVLKNTLHIISLFHQKVKDLSLIT